MTGFIIKRLPLVLFLAFYLFFVFFTYKDYGMTVDEFFVYTRGRYFYTKVRGNDEKLQKGFAVRDRNNQDLLYNNSTYPAFLYIFNDKESIEIYHLLNLLLATTIFVIFFEILLHFYKNPWLALLAPIFLFLTPRFSGDIPANPKDIPFAVVYFASLSAVFFTKNWEDKLKILFLGILFGLTASIRIIGLSLLPIFIIFNLIGQRFTWKKFFSILLFSFLIFNFSFLILLISLPYLAVDPFNHLIELINVTKTFPWYGKVLLFGKSYAVSQRPWWYLPIWLFVTSPIPILIFGLGSFFIRPSKETNAFKNLVLTSLILQFFFYLFFKPTVYNGLRHYLFLLPQMTILAVIFFTEALKKIQFNRWFIGLTLIFFSLVAYSIGQLHPYQYLYFNELTGGLKGAVNRFDIDYWGATEKEAITWLKNYLTNNHQKKANVFVCSKSHSLQYYLPEHNDVNTRPKKADYVICPDLSFISLVNKNKQIVSLRRISRLGAIINNIYQLK